MVRKDDHTDVIPVRRPDDGALDAEAPDDAKTSPPSPPEAAGEDTPSSPAVEHPCPHCGAELIDHDAPEGTPKHNAWHCDACGGCWIHRGSAWFLRPGHTAPAGWEGGTLSGGEP